MIGTLKLLSTGQFITPIFEYGKPAVKTNKPHKELVALQMRISDVFASK
jgi:hypothetical protein